ATDTTYTGPGVPGLLRALGGDAVLFDDVTITQPATGYAPNGTLHSTTLAPAQWQRWGELTFTKDTSAAGTSLTVDVLSAAGTLLASNVISGTNFNSIPAVASQSSIRLRANLSTS